MNKVFYIFLFVSLFLGNLALAKTINGKPKIIDGDTIHIKNNKIRLHGIDAPERKQICIIDSQDWYCGKQSTQELKKLINTQDVQCLINDVDIYNRKVAICSVNNTNINQWMVKNGWAIAYRYYSTDYVNDEKFARENKLGIWKSEFIEPYLYRKKNKQ